MKVSIQSDIIYCFRWAGLILARECDVRGRVQSPGVEGVSNQLISVTSRTVRVLTRKTAKWTCQIEPQVVSNPLQKLGHQLQV